MRVSAHDPLAVGHAHALEHGVRARMSFPAPQPLVVHGHLHELLAEGHGGIERGHRLLVDHGDRGTARPAQFLGPHGKDVAPLKEDLPGHDAAGLTEMPHDGERDGRLSTARFPHESMRLAGHECEIEVDHRRHDAASACVGNG